MNRFLLYHVSMKVYSVDLRKKIVDAVDNKLGTYREIAEMFNVHESYIYKLLRQQRELGHINPLPHGGGAHRKLTDKALSILSDLIHTQPDMTLSELQQKLKKKVKVQVSISTIWYGVKKLRFSVKKRVV